ncbi:MAG: Lrp/AsnC family transcriptional regulator [Thioploca sp.]|nr:Lrp/AsnC family transcriptional regulator [Thioploca sp.]
MDNLTESEQRLIETIQGGLPLVARPYAAVGEQIGLTEAEVIASLAHLIQIGVIKRLGIVVRHRQLGYRANAMVVWDVPDAQVTAIGQQLGQFDGVSLCYRRARHLPEWPYNLYCMIHGKDRNAVLRDLDKLIAIYNLSHIPHQVLFSRRCFKQSGACYTFRSVTICLPQRAAGGG